MTCTKRQIQILLQYVKTHGQEVAAAKAGVSLRTARKYLKNGGQAAVNSTRSWRTHKDAFDQVWDEVEVMLAHDPGLQAKTIMQVLIDRDESFHWGQLRTLQRRVRRWRALQGPEQEVMFKQLHLPGAQSQSDWTHCEELGVTVAGSPFPHMLFHFMLPYSRWETAYVSHSESFDELVSGYTRAIAELGAVPAEHRTDNLGAAVNSHGDRPVFTERWESVLAHYGARPSRNNPGESHENGSVEKSHHLLKSALDQALRVRGSREFPSVPEYEKFLRKVLDQRNRGRKQRMVEEMAVMKEPPERGWNDPVEERVVVNAFSLISVSKALYSVPSRLIGQELRALVYPEVVRLFLGGTLVMELPRQAPGAKRINYRHLVSQLVRKPGAFAGYVFRDDLFPTTTFRKAYDALMAWRKERADKEYLSVLHHAAMSGEADTEAALSALLEAGKPPLLSAVKELTGVKQATVPEVHIPAPDLCSYDELLSLLPRAHKEVSQ
jgi:transposase